MEDERVSHQINLFDFYLSSDEYYQQVKTSLRDPNATNDMGYTLLHAAASSRLKNTRILQLLLDKGADVEAVTPYCYTPLHLAVATRGRNNVDILIKNGASLAAQDLLGRTALHFAIGAFTYTPAYRVFRSSCDMWIVKRILSEPESYIDALDASGETPLMWAVNERNLKATNSLLKKGANPNIPNKWYQPPLHRALSDPDPNIHIVIELMRAGADIYWADNMGQSAVDIFLRPARVDDEAFELASLCLWWIALRHQRSDYLERQLKKIPALSAFFGKCCKEVNLMKGVILHGKFTLHDFVLDCCEGKDGLEIKLKVMEILLSGLFTEYFEAILARLSRHGLSDVLLRFNNDDLSYYGLFPELTRLNIFNAIRCFYGTNVYLRRQLFHRIENLLTIYNKC